MRLSLGLTTKLRLLELPFISNSSPSYNSNLVEPSRATQAELRLSSGFFRVTVVETGTIRGLKLRECGAKGVTQMHIALAYTIEPPADRLYAVLPVGVAMISPSPTKVVM